MLLQWAFSCPSNSCKSWKGAVPESQVQGYHNNEAMTGGTYAHYQRQASSVMPCMLQVEPGQVISSACAVLFEQHLANCTYRNNSNVNINTAAQLSDVSCGDSIA